MAVTLLQGTSKIVALSGPLKDVSLSTTSKTLTLAPRSLFPALSLSTTGKTLNLCRSVESLSSSSSSSSAAAVVKNKDNDNKSRSWSDLVEQVNELVDWFEKETMEAIKITQILRNDYNVLAHKLQLDESERKSVLFLEAVFMDQNEKEPEPEEEVVLLDELEEMFWILLMKWTKAEQAKTGLYLSNEKKDELQRWAWIRFEGILYGRVGRDRRMLLPIIVNELLDWFEKETMETMVMTQKLRKECHIIAQKLLDFDKAAEQVLLEKMFRDLLEKQARATKAKEMTANAVDQATKAAKLINCCLLPEI